MVKVIVTGAGGKMGGRIIGMISAMENLRVVGAIEVKGHPIVGRDLGHSLGTGRTGALVSDSLADCIDQADVVIDFTDHEASLNYLKIASEKNRAIVIGSTGFTAEEMKTAQKLAEKTRCVLSPNMSVGVNVMLKVLDYCAGILYEDYDVEIIEAHHHLKKDAPSGTALQMARVIAARLGRDLEKEAVYTRRGMIGERTRREIGIQTIRAGDIVGEHTVIFGGIGERLEIVHRAQSRDNFAKGAIRAAQWIVHQKNGLYDMQDVLGLRDSR
ncbi:MAG TPA: 4-hydroxy-tetrahydrodipicolinate reductase [Syntrophales bacterium]|jgi:4-hydroxy-tetrahydrodipicolinate reductase|nr:4-hydroxy-tetrahydrodipicolinate reductase [Deltaproteobacteria bacterium]HOG13468.1 4-hydroxy-tetrahydrodipicolinate reductase [Smithellaceae bacterium]HPN08434.1 4-hydroxy-tetrahydrodipicolinate reductase [Syntrophales bacterium]